MYRELLLGAGNDRTKPMGPLGHETWENLTTLDIDPLCKPDVICDLNGPLPFKDDTFDEIHAYCVLEHLGQQGNWQLFFQEFSEYWRVLKPGGFFFGKVPSCQGRWAWADPGHTRIILPETLVFLSQQFYRNAVGRGPATDYRNWYKADFALVSGHEDDEHFRFVIQAIKAASRQPHPDETVPAGRHTDSL